MDWSFVCSINFAKHSFWICCGDQGLSATLFGIANPQPFRYQVFDLLRCCWMFPCFLIISEAASSIKFFTIYLIAYFFFGVWDCKEKVQIFLISLWVDFSCVLAAFSNYGNTEGEPQIQWMNEWMNDNQSLCSESLLNFRYEVPGSRYFGSHFSYH